MYFLSKKKKKLGQGYLSSVLWPVSLPAFLLHTEDSSASESDKDGRGHGKSGTRDAKEDRQRADCVKQAYCY